MVAVRFLEDRVARDPDDLIALNKLAGYYLQSFRETSDTSYLTLAERAAQASLRVLGPDQNLSGLFALAQVRFAFHDFSTAAAYGRQLTEFQPDKSFGYQALGDALLELGEYQQAELAYKRIAELDPGSAAAESRLARLALLHGETDAAQRGFARSLAAERTARVPNAEAIAWCQWQLGETAFQSGRYKEAEQHYRDALTTFPKYVRALASLGRVRAALNDRSNAIEQYEAAIRIVPEPLFLTALGDLYQLDSRTEDAKRQFDLAEQIERLNQVNGALYGRQLAIFYADHDLKEEEAFEIASREYAMRHDVYGADALAWTALKAGKLSEAQAAIKQAIILGTKDARILYHAAAIERATGNQTAAKDLLEQALKLNPKFDPLQAANAKRMLSEYGR